VYPDPCTREIAALGLAREARCAAREELSGFPASAIAGFTLGKFRQDVGVMGN
jgi:hypothetical protein